jgi:hypothetical protein
MSGRRVHCLLFALLAMCTAAGLPATRASAASLIDDGGAEWRVEQPPPPPPPTGVQATSDAPIGLGKIGDIAFAPCGAESLSSCVRPNRGALITAGNGSTIPPGVWLYNGEGWREIANVCGATDGRIAWAGENEFWTISDARPGGVARNGVRPPLEDDSLCHFAPGPSGKLEVVASYASPAFESNSYQPMHAAACINPSDCWFGGDPLPTPQIGAFQLHWNGRTMAAAPYLPEGHTVRDMRAFEGHLYESVQLMTSDHNIKVQLPPPALRTINPEGSASTFEAVEEPEERELLYGPGEFSSYLDYLRLGADEDALWAAAGPSATAPENDAGVTVLRFSKTNYSNETGEYSEAGAPSWSQVLGPKTNPTGLARFPNEEVSSIAPEPGGHSAWVALAPKPRTSESREALVARISANGEVTDQLELPGESEQGGEHLGPKGNAETVVCPAAHDCWLTTTSGWLLHLAPEGQEHLPRDEDPVFAEGSTIEQRPLDEGVPQQTPDTVPAEEEPPHESNSSLTGSIVQTVPNLFATVAVPLLSHLRSRLVKGSTLELSFHLAVKARLRLLAKRHGKVVARTPMRTFKAGNHSLLLRLNSQRWPTGLDLESHALVPLPTVSTREPGISTVSTSLAFPRYAGLLESGPFRRLLR